MRIGDIAYSPDGRYVYATTAMRTPAPAPGGALIVIDALTGQVVDRIDLAADARRLALSADGRMAFVTAGLALWHVDLEQSRAVRSWYVGQTVTDVVLAPDGERAYVVFGNSDSAALGRIELNDQGLVSTLSLAGCSEPNRIALAADGRSLAITLERFAALILVDTETAAVNVLATLNVPGGLVAADLAVIPSLPSHALRPIAPESLFACDTAIAIEDTTAAPGEIVDVAVRIESEADIHIAGTQNEIIFDPHVLELDACHVDPTIGNHDGCDAAGTPAPCKDLYYNLDPCDAAESCPNGLAAWAMIRNVLLSISNVNPIPPGIAYHCRFRIRDDATPGTTTTLRCHEAGASDPTGSPLPVICRDGSVSVAAPATPTAAPTPTTTLPVTDVPLGDDKSNVTIVDAGGCQTTRGPAPMSLLLLVPPLLTLVARRRR